MKWIKILFINLAILLGLLVCLEIAAGMLFAVKGIIVPGDTAAVPSRYLQGSHTDHEQ
jgi:hypothetical protein